MTRLSVIRTEELVDSASEPCPRCASETRRAERAEADAAKWQALAVHVARDSDREVVRLRGELAAALEATIATATEALARVRAEAGT